MWDWTFRSPCEPTEQAVRRHQAKFPDSLWVRLEAAEGPCLLHPEPRESPACDVKGKTKAEMMAKCTVHRCAEAGLSRMGKEQPALLFALLAEMVIMALDCIWPMDGEWKAPHYNPLKESAFHLWNGCPQVQKNVYPFKFQETVDPCCFEKQSNNTGKSLAPILQL